MAEEMGKPVREGLGEVEKSAWAADHFAEHAQAYLADEILASDATRSWVQHLPLGPLVGILPWNAPLWLALRFAAPALMAGNPCLVKHDPHVPGCSDALGRLFAEAGFGPGVFDVLPIETGAVADVIRDERIRGVSFTGSSRGGAAVAAIAGAALKPSVLELGGSDPAIVLEDADVEAAVEMIGIMRIINAGQSCIAAKRILVHDAVHDRFVASLAARFGGLVVGDPRDPATDVGPIARADLREVLHRQVAETLAQGARCVTGGTLPAGPGFFYPPTLIADASNDMTACREETFGPVAAVVRIADAEAGVRIANETRYGLAASVFTDPGRGEAIARRLDAGQVAINGVVKTDPRLPSGGTKGSGWGKELGPHGCRAFTNAQQVWRGPKRA